ncbi:hypothetical protein [Falsirhodobacter sp. 20TX0035]|uniref:hypothetical protein n=1 Tax=Falsirhodobacter sp. 20TX0035 TaxID=3022019 RepID=UPI00232D5173|nr:hypothetical protein [Falsirhodobacter sp. 20TX0035]MDB6454884.1 hypothetical protein [Falsirhodobacter sp. 20TX0035]
MKKLSLAIVMAASLAACAGSGPVKRACLDTDRGASRSSTCTCIQRAADATLNGSEQRRAASLFGDPERAQAVRLSRTSADNAFWKRYSRFGETAQAQCR